MSDEVKDAERKVPWSMTGSVIINGVGTFAIIITLLFCIGDPVAALTTPTGYPVIEIARAALGNSGATVLTLFICWNGLIALFSSMASVSRLTWAFARDKGLPFSGIFGRVDENLHIPRNSLFLVATIVALLMLLNIASSAALFAILSLGNMALYSSYLIAVAFYFQHKLRGKHIDYGPFKLGNAGYILNVFAILFLIFIILWLPWPPFLPVTAESMNYAGPIFVAIVVLGVVHWFVWQRTRFSVPTTKFAYPIEPSDS